MSAFTVTGVHDRKEWTGNYGPMVSYVLDLEDESGHKSMDVELNRKPESREPEVGEQFVGHLESGKFGDKLKIDFEATKELHKGGGGSQFRSSETSTSNNSKPASTGEVDWDAKEARITRQAVLKVVAPTINELRSLTPEIKAVVEDIEKFVSEAPKRPLGQKASQGAVPATSSPQESPPLGAAPDSPPVDLSGARTEEPKPSLNFDKSEIPDDAHQWVESLLVVAGAGSAARELALYAVNKLRPDQLKTLEGELNDSEQGRKAEGLKRVEASYEKAEGHPVPDRNEDDIPF